MNIFLPLWAQLIFAINAVNFLLIAFLFYRGKNGRLRQVFIALFVVLGVGSSLRCLERYMGPFLEPVAMAVITGLPVLLMTSLVTIFLYKHYR